jgi:hypothetical protein
MVPLDFLVVKNFDVEHLFSMYECLLVGFPAEARRTIVSSVMVKILVCGLRGE